MSIDRESHFPLHTAFKENNHVFIQIALGSGESEKLKKVLMQKKGGRNYIQVALITYSPVLGDLVRKCIELSLQVWHGQKTSGRESETPLHIAIKKVYRMEINTLIRKKRLDDGLIAELFGKWRKNVQERRESTGNSSDDKMVSSNDVADFLGCLIKDSQNAQDSMAQVDIVKLLIEQFDGALAHQSRREDEETKIEVVAMPYQLRAAHLRIEWDKWIDIIKEKGMSIEREDTSEKAFRRAVIEDLVADTIRYRCLRYFKRDKIAQCLYQPGVGKLRLIIGPGPVFFKSPTNWRIERHIDFDLADLPNPSITKAFLNRLAKYLQFESILKYVALPKLALGDHEGDEDQSETKRSGPLKYGKPCAHENC